MNGYGLISKVAPSDWSLAAAIEGLTDIEKETLYDFLTQNKEAILLYVSKIYVIKNADFWIKESRKLTGGAKLDGAAFITASGAWTFDSVTENHKQFQDLILNITGDEVPVTLIKTINTKRLSARASEKARTETEVIKAVEVPTKVQQEQVISGEIQEQLKPKQ